MEAPLAFVLFAATFGILGVLLWRSYVTTKQKQKEPNRSALAGHGGDADIYRSS